MATRHPNRIEVPPTAGLTPHWRDLVPGGGSLTQRAAAFIDVDAVQAECSGTAALVVALTTLNRLSGRRVVVVPAYTCPLVALAVAHCGLELRLCDLAHDGIDFDAVALARAVDRDVLAVVPTHLGGRVVDVASTIASARAAGGFVIEDAAQALGARRGTRSVGLDGDLGFFSLAVGKGLTTYEGGLLVTRDAVLRRELERTSRELVPLRVDWELRRSIELLGYHLCYRPSLLRIAYGAPLRRALRRGDPVAAVGDDFSMRIPLHRLGRWRRSVGARAFTRLQGFLDDAAQRAQHRRLRLERIARIALITDVNDARGTWPFFLLRLPDARSRDAALERLWGAGLGVSRLFIHALPDYAYLQPFVGAHDVPNARAFAATTLTISNSPWLDDEAFEEICSTLESVLSRT